jgi:hypothetical protein
MVRRFRKWSDTRDDDCTGRPSTSRTDAKAAWVDENRLATNWDLCSHYSCPTELYKPTSLSTKKWNTAKYVHTVYRDTRRKSAKIDVSRFLFHIFSDFKKTETNFLISSGRVGTWGYHFTPRTQQAGVRWKHPASATVSVFWDAESVVTLNTCLGADQATWTPLGTRCHDFVRLWVGRDLDVSHEVWSCS